MSGISKGQVVKQTNDQKTRIMDFSKTFNLEPKGFGSVIKNKYGKEYEFNGAFFFDLNDELPLEQEKLTDGNIERIYYFNDSAHSFIINLAVYRNCEYSLVRSDNKK